MKQFSSSHRLPLLRKLIRSTTTKAFLTQVGTWTQDVRKAADFHNHSRAYQQKNDLHLNNIELYYLFGDALNPRYDFAVAL